MTVNLTKNKPHWLSAKQVTCLLSGRRLVTVDKENCLVLKVFFLDVHSCAAAFIDGSLDLPPRLEETGQEVPQQICSVVVEDHTRSFTSMDISVNDGKKLTYEKKVNSLVVSIFSSLVCRTREVGT